MRPPAGAAGWLPLGGARVLALLPLIGVGQACLEVTAKRNVVAHEDARAAAQASREDLLSRIPRDFILLPAETARVLPFRDSFLTLDPRRQLLFRIDGDNLEIFDTGQGLATALYSQYRDAWGQTLFQRYALDYGARLDALVEETG